MKLLFKNTLCIAAIVPLVLLSFWHSTSAQSLGSIQVDPVQYIVSPEEPGPNTPVSIEVQGIGNFLGNSNITWQENGTTVLNGVGDRNFNFTTGPVGSKTTIYLTIQTQQYGTITHTFTFYPSLVEMVWEADTTVPPLYAGKALYSAGASVRVVAFPNIVINGSKIDPNSLSFQWKEGNEEVGLQSDPTQSGMGRNIFTFNGNQLRQEEEVSVDVLFGNTIVGNGDIIIPTSKPSLVFYADDPLRGVLYNRALPSSLQLPTQELTVRAEPYFFSRSSANSGLLEYDWQLNGNETTGPNTAGGELTLRQTGNGQGNASLSVSLQNTDVNKLLQEANSEISIIFGSQNNGLSSFFGI